MLSALYRYGSMAYIGGAFKTGLHNTLEPIVYGLPVITGPKYQKFEEELTTEITDILEPYNQTEGRLDSLYLASRTLAIQYKNKEN